MNRDACCWIVILVMFAAQCCFCFALFSLLIVDLGVGGRQRERSKDCNNALG